MIINNEYLLVNIQPKGAELTRVYNKKTKLDYCWDADPAFWAKHSPVLFPIVGTLKNDTCYINGKAYKMGRHGFAREMDFTPSTQTEQSVRFILSSDESTLEKFPFHFVFSINYVIQESTLRVSYSVLNTGDTPMYFSVGAHPAFRVPLCQTESYNDYFLEFNQAESSDRWPISAEGLIETRSLPLLQHTRQLPLTKELFQKDALVFKDLRSNKISLLSRKSAHGLELDFTGFPYLGIWAARNADFVCIEPWCGIADSVSTDQQLAHKEGINTLQPQDAFERSWSARFF